MKAHLTERYVKGLQPQPKNVIVYDEEVVGFGVRITSVPVAPQDVLAMMHHAK